MAEPSEDDAIDEPEVALVESEVVNEIDEPEVTSVEPEVVVLHLKVTAITHRTDPKDGSVVNANIGLADAEGNSANFTVTERDLFECFTEGAVVDVVIDPLGGR